MPTLIHALLLAILLLSTAHLQAEEKTSLSFYHQDWELICDNTRTCRAAGYHSEENQANPFSVLLTRKAGPDEPVRAEITLAKFDDEIGNRAALELNLKINGNMLGQLKHDQKQHKTMLTPKQVQALLAALKRDSQIEFFSTEENFILSDKGAAAVLLKMDEYQGRIDTPGAIIKKGNKPERSVLNALPAPEITPGRIARPKPDDDKIVQKRSTAILAALKKALQQQNEVVCDLLNMASEEMPEDTPILSVNRLTKDKLLLSAACWRGAYNAGDLFVVADDTPNFANPIFVTTDGVNYDKGVIYSAQKGRGFGDCWHSADWTWDGKRFVLSGRRSTGICKGVSPGGTWNLPIHVTKIRKSRQTSQYQDLKSAPATLQSTNQAVK